MDQRSLHYFISWKSCINYYLKILAIKRKALKAINLFFLNFSWCREEVFGPVAPLIRFSTEEEAIKMANDTVFGKGK